LITEGDALFAQAEDYCPKVTQLAHQELHNALNYAGNYEVWLKRDKFKTLNTLYSTLLVSVGLA
jgi:hypothetical protein